jgi:hypothetical protein
MTTPRDGPARPRRRPGPKPRGRTVIPLTITVTHAQRTALDALADAEKSSISMVVRRFIAAGPAAGGLFILTALIETTITHRTGATKEPPWTRTH